MSGSERNGKRQLEVHDALAGGRHTISAAGELDMASAPALKATMERICEGRAAAITLDLSGLTFIDSTGLHVIVSTSQRCRELGIDFELVPGPQQIQRLFEVTGLLDVLPFQAAA
jgi:anti-sigma B factor antagonist